MAPGAGVSAHVDQQRNLPLLQQIGEFTLGAIAVADRVDG
jgi:hypothetical protein